MLFLQILFGAFQAPKPALGLPTTVFPGGLLAGTSTQSAINSKLSRHRRLAHNQLRFHKSSLRCIVGRGR